MEIETLDADFYRERARLCHKLADAAGAAKPLFARLYLLARAYEERAERAEQSPRGKPGSVSSPTLLAGWPDGDGPENYRYSSMAPPAEPEDDGVVPPLVIPEPISPEDDGVVPPLVLRARQMGIDV